MRTALVINATADRFRHTVLSISGDTSGGHRIHPNGSTRLEGVSKPAAWGGYPRVLTRTLRELRPDLLLTYGWGGVDAILAARLCGLSKIIHGEDGFLPEEAHRQKARRLMARRVLLRAASCVVVPSQTLVEIADRCWHLPHRKVRYVPNGVDASRFSAGSSLERSAARRRFGFHDTDVVIGTVGHLRPEKNHAGLIHAFSQLPGHLQGKLFLVGDGDLRPALEHQVTDLKLTDRVVFAGVVPDPVGCYRAMDLFALASDTEQMPIVILEAMATGLVVLSTDVGDVRAMLSVENQPYVLPLRDDAAYARALTALVQEPQARMTLGRINRSRCVEMYDLRVMVDRYQTLYSELLGRQPN